MQQYLGSLVKKMLLSGAFIIGLFISQALQAQTTLVKGDIAFTGYISVNPTGAGINDQFTFVLLTPITNGTTINFTDNAWLRTNSTTGSWRIGEGTVTWTSNGAYAVGTEIKIEINSTFTAATATYYTPSGSSGGAGTCSGTTMPSLSVTGDQVVAYQGATATPTFISAIHMNVYSTAASDPVTTTVADWDGAFSTGNSCGLPALTSVSPSNFLTTGVDAIWIPGSIAPEVYNARFNCTGALTTAAQIRAAVYNVNNWTQNTSNQLAPTFTLPTTCSYAAATTTTWNGTTWSNGVPSATVDAIIAGSITPGSFTCQTLTINNGVALTLGSGNTATLNGNLTNNGNGMSGTGTLHFASSGTVSGNMLSLSGTLTVASGATLTTGGLVTLASDASNTGRIGNSAGTISGNVTVQRYIPGKRAFRFLAHPFNGSLPMSQLTDNIDITGTGGAPFTTTATNNPSAFSFNVNNGDNSTTGNNPGWAAFTASGTWARYQAMRVLVRGSKGEGLTSAPYTPSAVTIDMTGPVNQGSQVVPLAKGSNTNFVLVGNPFPSPIDLNATTSRTNVGSSFYVWDATIGTKGGYTSAPFSSSFILPACASFVTTLSSGGSITFPESCKSAGTPVSLFKTTSSSHTVQLRIEDTATFWDRLLLNFDDQAASVVDYDDAPELYNPEVSFYTFSSDDSMLSIDTRPYSANSIIRLGLYTPYEKNFKIVAADFDMPAGTKLFLKDNYLNKTEEITGTGYEYWFTVTGDTASWGNNRFELMTDGIATGVVNTLSVGNMKVTLAPNPVTNQLTVYYENAGHIPVITVTNLSGGKVAETNGAATGTGNITVSMENVASGIYLVTIRNGKEFTTHRIIKQ